jgi:hypothetical protein
MKSRLLMTVLALGLIGQAGLQAANDVPAAGRKVVPAAIFAFEERGAGVKDYGQKVSDILFASLVVDPNLVLVDRAELTRILDELSLNLSGAVTPSQAVKVGQLTGARILVAGSVIEADQAIYLVAKIIGTETGRVLGQSVKGKMGDEIGPLAEELAKKIAATLEEQSGILVAAEVKPEARLATLKTELGEAKRPVVMIRVIERHVGGPAIDPAAQTELALICREAGFEVLDAQTKNSQKADVILEGEGFSELALQRGNLVSVKARLEIKAVDCATDKVLAVDRQTVVMVDLSEQIAGKAALQEAAAAIATRLLPKIVVK